MHRTFTSSSSVLSQTCNFAQFVPNKCYHVNIMFNLFFIFNRSLQLEKLLDLKLIITVDVFRKFKDSKEYYLRI